jgi:hypothetical protein
MTGQNRLEILGRRQFLGVAVGTLAAAELALGRSASAGLVVDRPVNPINYSAPDSFPDLKQIDAGVLNVGYVEAGPIDGPAAILLHGWPYDIHSFGEVTPRLASAGFRVIVPYTRGYGSTSFLASETPRTGQPSSLAVDTISLMDALDIRQATVAGFDWGARTTDILGALWPDRVKGIVSASEGRVAVVVPILFRDGARSRRLLQIPAGVRRVDLEACVTKVGFRRGDIRTQRSSAR